MSGPSITHVASANLRTTGSPLTRAFAGSKLLLDSPLSRSLSTSRLTVLTFIFGDRCQTDASSGMDSPSVSLAHVYGTLACVPWP